MRKMRVFQQDPYISIDFQSQEAAIYKKQKGLNLIPGLPNIGVEKRSFAQGGPLKDQIDAFIAVVRDGTPPLVTGAAGKRALEIANWISAKLWHEVTE